MRRHRRAAVALAYLGLATATASMAWVWSWLTSADYRPPGSMWPLPALYLIEAVVLPAIVCWAVVFDRNRGTGFGAWPALGALAAMAGLGVMSIGPNMAVALVFLVPASVLGDGARSTTARKMVGFVLGGLLQAGVMFAIIQYMIRGPWFGPHGGLTRQRQPSATPATDGRQRSEALTAFDRWCDAEHPRLSPEG